MKILIVMDMQNDFIDGSLGTKSAQKIVPFVRGKIYEHLSQNQKVIFTRETNYDNYLKTLRGHDIPISHCIYGSHGWEITSAFEKIERRCHIINKETFGCYELPDAILSCVGEDVNIEEIQLIGLCTDVSIIANALILRAGFPETKISIVENCCAGTTDEKHKATLEVMKSCQIYIN